MGTTWCSCPGLGNKDPDNTWQSLHETGKRKYNILVATKLKVKHSSDVLDLETYFCLTQHHFSWKTNALQKVFNELGEVEGKGSSAVP